VRRDPLIIGAGPAGTAAAITLARSAHRPVVVERSTGPTDKVCGDFLSADTILRSKSLGVDPAALGATTIRRIRLIHGERTAEADLPFPAMGLSRRVLDAALLRCAENAGAVVRSGQTVRHLARDGNQWTVQFADGSAVIAETVFLATGKHDIRELPRSRTDQGAIGMKMYFALQPGPAKTLGGTIELTLFPGGYAGLQPVEDDQAVLCIAIRRGAFQVCGANWPSLLEMIAASSRRFGTMLTGARPLLSRPLAVAGIPYGYQARAGPADGLFRLGDQAAVIPSLTGDGMAIALHSGQEAAAAWLMGADSTTYHRALTRTLVRQMRLAGLLHHASMSGVTQAVAVQFASLFPGLLRQAARQTRLRPQSAAGDA
jgi:flavin-dependent dehydrogenase